MGQAVYLVGDFEDEEGDDVREALVGPEGLDIPALRAAFEEKHDLVFAEPAPTGGGIEDPVSRVAWRAWSRRKDAFIADRSHIWPDYRELFVDYLVKNAGCQWLPFLRVSDRPER